MRCSNPCRSLLVGLSLIFVLSACGSSEEAVDVRGKTVTMHGPDVDAQSFIAAMKPLEERTGIRIDFKADPDFQHQIDVRVDQGSPPDIAIFPQPGKITDFSSKLKALPSDVAKVTKSDFDAGWTNLVTMNGKTYGVPVKAELKSLVWYNPKIFTAAGYKVPETFDAFLALTDQMIKDGKTPLCVGLGSDAATGWPFTDWVEDFVLRIKGPKVYDDWASHKIPFSDPQIVESAQAVVNLWSKPGAVLGGVKSVVGTPFAVAGLPLLDGKCMMYRQSDFYAAIFPAGTQLGPSGTIDAFYLPANDKFGRVTLSSGNFASMFSNRPEVVEVMRYLASRDYANARAAAGGLSPNKFVDTTKYRTPIEQSFGSILAKAGTVRFDASDQMPSAVGAGTFWTAAIDITNGVKDVNTAFQTVEVSWPRE